MENNDFSNSLYGRVCAILAGPNPVIKVNPVVSNNLSRLGNPDKPISNDSTDFDNRRNERVKIVIPAERRSVVMKPEQAFSRIFSSNKR